MKIFDATLLHHGDVTKVLERFRRTKLTYVDASSLVHLEQKKISVVWSTDHHLGLNGAQGASEIVSDEQRFHGASYGKFCRLWNRFVDSLWNQEVEIQGQPAVHP